jgi:hypothetical protein
MKRFSLLGIAALALLGLAGLNSALNADEYDRKTVISISQPLEVPGVVLPPGTYVMRLFNSSTNRHIVQFMNERQNQQLALTFAIPAERIRPAEKTILTMYEGSQGAPPAARTWFYPGDTVGQEFLYPHKQAVSISERTKVAVPEIETGKPAEVSTAEAVKTDDDEAESIAQSRVESPLIARAEPAPEPIPAPEPQQAVQPPPQTEPETPAAQSDAVSTSSDSLPKTAGNGPLALLLGSLAFVAAFALRKMKRSGTH